MAHIRIIVLPTGDLVALAGEEAAELPPSVVQSLRWTRHYADGRSDTITTAQQRYRPCADDFGCTLEVSSAVATSALRSASLDGASVRPPADVEALARALLDQLAAEDAAMVENVVCHCSSLPGRLHSLCLTRGVGVTLSSVGGGAETTVELPLASIESVQCSAADPQMLRVRATAPERSVEVCVGSVSERDATALFLRTALRRARADAAPRGGSSGSGAAANNEGDFWIAPNDADAAAAAAAAAAARDDDDDDDDEEEEEEEEEEARPAGEEEASSGPGGDGEESNVALMQRSAAAGDALEARIVALTHQILAQKQASKKTKAIKRRTTERDALMRQRLAGLGMVHANEVQQRSAVSATEDAVEAIRLAVATTNEQLHGEGYEALRCSIVRTERSLAEESALADRATQQLERLYDELKRKAKPESEQEPELELEERSAAAELEEGSDSSSSRSFSETTTSSSSDLDAARAGSVEASALERKETLAQVFGALLDARLETKRKALSSSATSAQAAVATLTALIVARDRDEALLNDCADRIKFEVRQRENVAATRLGAFAAARERTLAAATAATRAQRSASVRRRSISETTLLELESERLGFVAKTARLESELAASREFAGDLAERNSDDHAQVRKIRSAVETLASAIDAQKRALSEALKLPNERDALTVELAQASATLFQLKRRFDADIKAGARGAGRRRRRKSSTDGGAASTVELDDVKAMERLCNDLTEGLQVADAELARHRETNAMRAARAAYLDAEVKSYEQTGNAEEETESASVSVSASVSSSSRVHAPTPEVDPLSDFDEEEEDHDALAAAVGEGEGGEQEEALHNSDFDDDSDDDGLDML